MLKLLRNLVRYFQLMLLLAVLVKLNQQAICFFLSCATAKSQSSVPAAAKILSKSFFVVVWKRVYKLCQPDIFATINLLLRILATLSVSFATVKRSFSMLQLITSDLPTTFGQTRLNSLCPMNTHNDILISTDAIIKTFAATSCKIKL